MLTYAILQNPGHNRVYFKSARALALQEFGLQKLSTDPVNLREEILGGLPYLLFDSEGRLTESDMITISNLSFVYGIFEYEKGMLIPLEKELRHQFDEDIVTILKYTGKTNELFTRMLLNIATSCASSLNILDPLCGKGTTLFEGLLRGYNVCGVDTDSKMISEAYTFLKKYLEKGRYKHQSHQERQGLGVGVEKYTAKRYQIKLENASVEFIDGDTKDVGNFYRKNTFHAIVGDLPYGVQHTARKTRNFLPVLTEALPGWFKVLKPGGRLVLAWNLFLIERQDIESALEAAGFTLLRHKGDESFVHRVDQAILRDVIVASK